MSLDLFFEEPLPDSVHWRLLRCGQESHFEARRLPVEMRSQKVSLEALRQAARGFSEALDQVGDSLGNCFPADLSKVLRAEPVSCWFAGETPWELARIAGVPLAYGRSLARRVRRAGEEVVPRVGGPARAALVHDGVCQSPAGLNGLFEVSVHAASEFRAVLSSEDYAVVLASGSFEPFRSLGRHYVPRLVVLHGNDLEPLTRALTKLGVDTMLATQWEVPWECCAAFLTDVLAQMREGADLGEAVGGSRSKFRDPWRTDLSLWLLGNPRLRIADLLPSRLEQSRTRSAQVRPAYLLHFLEGPEAGKTVPLFAALLSAGRPLSVGGPGPHDNDIDLDDDTIPCRCFWLEGQEGRLVLSGSVLVNGLPVVGKLALEGGELLEVGQTLMRFQVCERRSRSAATAPTPGPLPAASRYWLELVGGDQRFSIDRSQTLVGRALDCDLVVADETVSRRHCLLVRSEGNHCLRKLGGGLTLVNGLVVESETRLRHGDRLQLGESSEWLFLDARRLPGSGPAD